MMKTQLANKRWFEIRGDQLFYFKAKGVSYKMFFIWKICFPVAIIPFLYKNTPI